jgi:hypothetical protein
VNLDLSSPAVFSEDTSGPDRRGKYRYTLWRTLEVDLIYSNRTVMFVGLNPSTATETVNDPTVRRCMNYARGWNFGRMAMMNIFAFRSTAPVVMLNQKEAAIGPQNNAYLIEVARQSDMIVAAWGSHGKFLGRGPEVLDMLRRIRPVHYLQLNKDSSPSHPLYLHSSLKPKLCT